MDNATYEVIPYVWGDPKQTPQILCNRGLLNVTVSLHGALQWLRRLPMPGGRVLWADAICIDQSNIDERNAQVTMMGSIYKRATGVHVWLGEDTNGDAQPAFEMIEKINDYYAQCYRLVNGYACYESPDAPPSDESLFDILQWKHLHALVRRPWFSRMWTLQEVGLAQTADAYWGQWSIKFSHIVEAFNLIDRNACFTQLLSVFGNFLAKVVIAWGGNRCTSNIERTWKRECSLLRFYSRHPANQERRRFINVLVTGN